MDFPDLGAAVDMPKRDKMPRAPPRKGGGGGGGGGGGEVRPKSALQAMLDTKNGPGTARAERTDASAEAVPAHALEDIGPPPKPVAEPDAAAHQEAITAIQARIDEGEKRVVCLPFAERGRAVWHARCGACRRTRPAA